MEWNHIVDIFYIMLFYHDVWAVRDVAFISIRNQTIVNFMLANDETDRLLYACILNVDHDNKRTIFKEI